VVGSGLDVALAARRIVTRVADFRLWDRTGNPASTEVQGCTVARPNVMDSGQIKRR